MPIPYEDEDRSEFMDRCLNDPTMDFYDPSIRYDICDLMWGDRSFLHDVHRKLKAYNKQQNAYLFNSSNNANLKRDYPVYAAMYSYLDPDSRNYPLLIAHSGFTVTNFICRDEFEKGKIDFNKFLFDTLAEVNTLKSKGRDKKIPRIWKDFSAAFERVIVEKQTLYVRRDLINADEVINHFKSQGLLTTLEDLHVTIAFSREPVAWGNFEPQKNNLIVNGGARSIKRLGEKLDALVLKFENSELEKRHKEFRDGGASWDWPQYQPHVTISYVVPPEVDPEPFTGELVFGPEVFEELDEDWKDNAKEKGYPEFDPDQDRDEHGAELNKTGDIDAKP